jgi:nucleoside 2-deoxyribosyltransferase
MVNVYLSGHMHNNWREKIIIACSQLDINFLVPFKGTIKTDERFFAVRDKLSLNSSDIVFAYIQDTPDYKNARYFGLGLELGYAAAQNKVIILVNELKDKIESFDFAIPFATAYTNDFNEGIELLIYSTIDKSQFKKYQ